MLESKLSPGGKGGKRSDGKKNGAAANALAAMLARGSPLGGGRSNAHNEKSAEEKVSHSSSENKALNIHRFSKGKDEKIAWRAAAGARGSKRSPGGGKKVMELASAFKQAQSALDQLMSSKEKTTKKIIQTKKKKKEKEKENDTSQFMEDDSSSASPEKSLGLVHELEQVLEERMGVQQRKDGRKNDAKEKEMMEMMETSSAKDESGQTKQNNNKHLLQQQHSNPSSATSKPLSCQGLFLPWYVILLLSIFALVGVSIVSIGVWTESGSSDARSIGRGGAGAGMMMKSPVILSEDQIVVSKQDAVKFGKRRRTRRRKEEEEEEGSEEQQGTEGGVFLFDGRDHDGGGGGGGGGAKEEEREKEEERRRMQKNDENNEKEDVFDGGGGDVVRGHVHNQPTYLFPVTSNRKKKGKCVGNGMTAGCVYTATTTRVLGSKGDYETDKTDETKDEKEEKKETKEKEEKEKKEEGDGMREKKEEGTKQAVLEEAARSGVTQKRSGYRQWQLRKRKEEEATKRKETEMKLPVEDGVESK